MNADERGYMNGLAEGAIGAAFEVSNVLGCGFLEKVYRNALLHELTLRGVAALAERRVPVSYKTVLVGDYIVDIMVEKQLVLELKCVSTITDEHMAQTLNYLKATGLNLALILNFQKPRVEIKRVVRDF